MKFEPCRQPLPCSIVGSQRAVLEFGRSPCPELQADVGIIECRQNVSGQSHSNTEGLTLRMPGSALEGEALLNACRAIHIPLKQIPPAVLDSVPLGNWRRWRDRMNIAFISHRPNRNREPG